MEDRFENYKEGPVELARYTAGEIYCCGCLLGSPIIWTVGEPSFYWSSEGDQFEDDSGVFLEVTAIGWEEEEEEVAG